MALDQFQQLIRTVSDQYESDVMLYIGTIDRPFDDTFISRLKSFKRRKNLLLLLSTLGGDPHAAYRIGRFIQEIYQTVDESDIPGGVPHKSREKGKFLLFVDTRCKSAGTILATGANILMFSDLGELGPIDVQLRKGDEVGERSSGLTPMHSLESLQQLAFKHFEDTFRGLRFNEQLAFTTKTASEIATKMVVGLFGPIFGQIDPMRIGEFDRAMRIAADYGNRLGKGNLKDDSLRRLLAGYPSHSFVIDKKEARDLFKAVETPTEELRALGEVTRRWWLDEHLSADQPLILSLTTDSMLDTNDEPSSAAPSDL